MSMTTKLQMEIEERLDAANELDPTTKLMDRAIEIEKLESSESQNEKQMKEERKARLIRNLIDIGAIVLPLGVTLWGVKASLYFEDENTVTTTVGRKFMDKLFNFRSRN